VRGESSRSVGPDLFGLDGKLLIKPRSFAHYEAAARPLAARERADLLRAVSKPAISRLPNQTLRAKATALRAAIAREHARGRAAGRR
jgi:hypothetical protein